MTASADDAEPAGAGVEEGAESRHDARDGGDSSSSLGSSISDGAAPPIDLGPELRRRVLEAIDCRPVYDEAIVTQAKTSATLHTATDAAAQAAAAAEASLDSRRRQLKDQLANALVVQRELQALAKRVEKLRKQVQERYPVEYFSSRHRHDEGVEFE